jgi:hypothetical protein
LYLGELLYEGGLVEDRIVNIVGDSEEVWLLGTHESVQKRVGGGWRLGRERLRENHGLLDVELVVLFVHAFDFLLFAADFGFHGCDLKSTHTYFFFQGQVFFYQHVYLALHRTQLFLLLHAAL